MRAMYVPFVCSLLMPVVTATAQEFRATLTGVIRHLPRTPEFRPQ